MDQDQQHFPYKIGAVATLSGLPASTIRTWERRYGTIEPHRTSGGARRYSDQDVERLTLIRVLSDEGMSVQELSTMSTAQLRRAQHVRPQTFGPQQSILLLDDGLRRAWQRGAQRSRGRDPDPLRLEQGPNTLEELLNNRRRVDAVVLPLADLGERPGALMRRLLQASSARLVVVTYDFAPNQVLDQLAAHGVWLLRGSVTQAELRRTLTLGLRSRRPADHERVARTFDEDQLDRLREISTSVACECPHHLATLVSRLVAFEQYAHDCENRNDEDAALHARLARGTARARALMETLLVEVCAHDGIDWEHLDD